MVDSSFVLKACHSGCILEDICFLLDSFNMQPRYTLRTFVGHSAPVLSLDFHPKEEDLVCSCDDATEIRYWSIKSGGCAGLSKVQDLEIFLNFIPSSKIHMKKQRKNILLYQMLCLCLSSL